MKWLGDASLKKENFYTTFAFYMSVKKGKIIKLGFFEDL